MAEADQLARELSTSHAKVTSENHESLEAWRASDHDDLVLALACAFWLAEREPHPGTATGPVTLTPLRVSPLHEAGLTCPVGAMGFGREMDWDSAWW
jgi:hypothetical protein